MKNIRIIAIPLNMAKAFVLMGIFSLMFIKTSTAETIQPGVSFQVFYDELLPYGDWISDPVHGYVWVPYAEPDFQPYATNGHWVMTTYGNTWVSNYDWGWAPFHYGRWYFDDYLGWAWVPDYEWGPAWVNWRTGGGYYGWAPLMPGISIHMAINIPSHHWVFVPQRRLVSRNIYNYYLPRKNVYNIYNQTTIINNTYVNNNRTYVSGPNRREIESVTRRTVPVYQVNNSNRPGRAAVSRNSLNVYRPEVRQVANSSRSAQARPSRVVTANEHKVRMANRSSDNSNRNSARTAPTNSRSASASRTVEPGREQNRRIETNVNNNSRTVREQTRPTYQRSAPSSAQGGAVRQTREQPKQEVNVNQNRRVQSSGNQSRPAVRQSQAPNQVRPSGQPAPRSRAVQSSRPTNQVRSQEGQRSRSTPNVSSRSSSERSSGNAARSSAPTSRSSRGNN